MDLESWGNLASFAKGATEGYQTQTELELKRKRDAEELRLKKEALDVDLMGKGLIKGPDDVWVWSPEAKEKQKIDSDYKKALTYATNELGKQRSQGGNLGFQLKALSEGAEIDPLSGNLRAGKYMQDKQQLAIDAIKADISKKSGIAPLSEAPSVAALNQQKTMEAAAKLRDEYGLEIGPKGEVIKIENWVKPWNKEELDKIKYYREELGKELNPRTGEQKPIKGWKPKKQEKDIFSDTATRKLADKIVTQSSFFSTIKSTIDDFDNPKLSEKEKRDAGIKIAKIINSAPSGSVDATTGNEADRAIGMLSYLPNEYKLKPGIDYEGFNQSIKAIVKKLKKNVQDNEAAAKALREGKDISSTMTLPTEPEPKPKLVFDQKLVDKANKAINDPKASENAKAGARKYLNLFRAK
jgi:hypothetical protein